MTTTRMKIMRMMMKMIIRRRRMKIYYDDNTDSADDNDNDTIGNRYNNYGASRSRASWSAEVSSYKKCTATGSHNKFCL